MNRKKHAYLILAHNNFYILEKLLKSLDDSRNDIYIHIDKKVNNFYIEYFSKILDKSKVFYVDRYDIKWGRYSLIKAELELFKSAVSNRYEYYHLLSGVDLPLKSQDYIHNFFEKNAGTEFITCATKEFIKRQNIKERYSLYYVENKFIMKLQRKLKINRYNDDFEIGYGSNWCSLTHDAITYILDNEKWIEKKFKYSTCCDEVYKQTLLLNSKFKESIYYNPVNENTISFNMRFIKWIGGSHPYVWRISNYNELLKSDCLFARKFDCNIDKDIVDKVYKNLNKMGE